MRTLMRFQSLAAITTITACLGLGFLGCGGPNEDAAIGVSVNNVLDDPNAYYGSRLTVSGTVDEIISPTVFTIQGGEEGGDLLVVSVDSIAPASGRSMSEPVVRDDIVQVTGQVREFIQDDLEEEYGFSLGEGAEDYEGRPVIIARNASATLSSIVVTPQHGGAATPPREAELITDLSAIAGDDAGELAGEAVHLQNLMVSEAVDESSFWATSGADSLFVVLVSGALSGEELGNAGPWEVSGILRELPTATVLAAEWDLSADLIRQLQGDPVYLHGIRATPAE